MAIITTNPFVSETTNWGWNPDWLLFFMLLIVILVAYTHTS